MVTAEDEDTLAVCPKCNGSGRIEPDESGYDGCDLCNYGDGPTGFVNWRLVNVRRRLQTRGDGYGDSFWGDRGDGVTYPTEDST